MEGPSRHVGSNRPDRTLMISRDVVGMLAATVRIAHWSRDVCMLAASNELWCRLGAQNWNNLIASRIPPGRVIWPAGSLVVCLFSCLVFACDLFVVAVGQLKFATNVKRWPSICSKWSNKYSTSAPAWAQNEAWDPFWRKIFESRC